MTGDGQGAIVATFARALRREAHVLATRPELTWQQLHNRLQWADPPLADHLTAERERRSHPGARPWIHRYSRLQESEALVRTLTGHTGAVRGVAIAPDGRWIVSASADHTLKTWDAATGDQRATMTGHTDEVTWCAVSPDGTWIVSAGADRTLRIWDAASGSERATLSGHTNRVNSCAVSPDGTWIVSASNDGTLKTWDVATGSEQATLTDHAESVNACAVGPDGTWIVSASNDETLKIWDVAGGTVRATLTGHTDSVLGCAVSPDGTWIVSASDDGVPEDLGETGPRQRAVDTLKTWGVTGGTSTSAPSPAPSAATTASRSNRVNACAVGPDGTWIVSAGQDQTLKIWDALVGRELATLAGHSDSVFACAVSPDGTWVVSGSGDRTLRIWDVAPAADPAVLPGHAAGVTGCAVSPDGAWVVSAADDHTLRTWDTAIGAEHRTLSSYFSCCDCAVSPDGAWIVSGVGLALTVWDAATGDVRREGYSYGDHHGSGVSACAVSPDGTWIVSASHDQTLKIWDAAFDAEGAKSTLIGHTDSVSDCAVSPDGTWIVSASADSTLKIWNTASTAVRATLTGHASAVTACAVSPDGTWLVSASRDQTLRIWDAASGIERGALMRHADAVLGCAASPDGRWVASASRDRTIRIWDATSCIEQAALVLPGTPTAVAFHPSAPVVACGDAAGGVHLARIIGIELGPLVTTSTALDDGLSVRCPACREDLAVANDQLGTETTCPRPACGRRLRINPFVRPIDGPRPSHVDPAPRLGVVEMAHLPPPAPAARPAPALADLVARSGLRFLDVASGELAIPFEGTRAEQLVVHARTLGSGLAFLAVALPRPGMFGTEAALRSLLGVSFQADFVKALVFADGELALACEQDLALLTPERVRGLVAGLAALGDVQKGDLGDAAGWERRLLACRRAQADIAVDPEAATAALRGMAAADGLAVRVAGPGTLVVALDPLGAGTPLQLVARVSEHLVSLVAYLGTKPKGNKGAYLRRLLELNRAADVARAGLDADGEVALLYEAPGVAPDLLDRVRQQLGGLLLGVLALERGD